MKKSIQEFKDIHKGQDIWIIAKGASLNYINKSFFEGKITIGINDIDMWAPTTYLTRKEFSPADEGLTPRQVLERLTTNNTKLCLSEYNGCVEEWGKNEDKIPDLFQEFDIWTFITPFTHGELVGPDNSKGEELPASLSSTAMAMWLAALMGAKNIILCGNDEGKLDGKDYADGLPPYACGSDHTWILEWQASQSIVVRNQLRDAGYNIYSLHPFINLKLENHKVI